MDTSYRRYDGTIVSQWNIADTSDDDPEYPDPRSRVRYDKTKAAPVITNELLKLIEYYKAIEVFFILPFEMDVHLKVNPSKFFSVINNSIENLENLDENELNSLKFNLNNILRYYESRKPK